MAQMTIRRLDDELYRKLRIQAARHRRGRGGREECGVVGQRGVSAHIHAHLPINV
jgi:hypothetical protein